MNKTKIKFKAQIGNKLYNVSEINMAGLVFYFTGKRNNMVFGSETRHAWWKSTLSSNTTGEPTGNLSPEDTIEEKPQAKLFLYLNGKKLEVN